MNLDYDIEKALETSKWLYEAYSTRSENAIMEHKMEDLLYVCEKLVKKSCKRIEVLRLISRRLPTIISKHKKISNDQKVAVKFHKVHSGMKNIIQAAHGFETSIETTDRGTETRGMEVTVTTEATQETVNKDNLRNAQMPPNHNQEIIFPRSPKPKPKTEMIKIPIHPEHNAWMLEAVRTTEFDDEDDLSRNTLAMEDYSIDAIIHTDEAEMEMDTVPKKIREIDSSYFPTASSSTTDLTESMELFDNEADETQPNAIREDYSTPDPTLREDMTSLSNIDLTLPKNPPKVASVERGIMRKDQKMKPKSEEKKIAFRPRHQSVGSADVIFPDEFQAVDVFPFRKTYKVRETENPIEQSKKRSRRSKKKQKQVKKQSRKTPTEFDFQQIANRFQTTRRPNKDNLISKKWFLLATGCAVFLMVHMTLGLPPISQII